MVKQKKKRNKVYKGSGAATVRPTVTRVSAVRRNKMQLWWLDNKRLAKPLLIVLGIVIVVSLIVSELIRLFSA